MPNEILIRPMCFEDLDQVYRIEQESFPNPWPKYFFEKDLESAQTIALIAEDHDRIIAYAVASCVDVEFHIANIAVAEGYQRQGIASQLMAALEDVANERVCKNAYLEVRTNNLPAIRLYEKLGYQILYLRRQYYIDGDDAYVMHKEL